MNSAFIYEHTDIPPGLTLADWRRQQPRRQRRMPFAALRSSIHLPATRAAALSSGERRP